MPPSPAAETAIARRIAATSAAVATQPVCAVTSSPQPAIDAGMDRYENQLENDLPAGHGGDELNEGTANVPPASYSRIEPGGDGGC